MNHNGLKHLARTLIGNKVVQEVKVQVGNKMVDKRIKVALFNNPIWNARKAGIQARVKRKEAEAAKRKSIKNNK